jgi:hypothetical protein
VISYADVSSYLFINIILIKVIFQHFYLKLDGRSFIMFLGKKFMKTCKVRQQKG